MEAMHSPYDDLGTKAYHALRDMIARGELVPGQKLIQEEMAELLGVSRTPLLQAISKLTKDHYLETIPRRGSYVKQFSAREILDAFDIRSLLEPMGAWQAASCMTDSVLEELSQLVRSYQQEAKSPCDPVRLFALDHAFHLKIMQSSGNGFLVDIMGNFDNILCNSERLLKKPAQTVLEHTAVLSALEKGDAKLARESMYNHVHGDARMHLAALLQYEGFAKERSVYAEN